MKTLEVKADLSKEDIETFMNWMDVSEDGVIDFQEFQNAFRRARRAHAEQASLVTGRDLVRRLDNWMIENN